MEVPRSLRSWFVAHGAIAVAAALPLLAAPEHALGRLGWPAVDPVTSRLVGAALLALGATSLSARDASVEVCRAVLRLNLVWSLAAASALFVGVGANAPSAAWVFLSSSIAFAGVWLHHLIRFRQLDRLATLDDSPEPGNGSPDEETE
jgi:hypothetical protein